MTSGQGDGEQTTSSTATVICSDCARNGKTLFAKLATDLLTLRHGSVPHVFDTDTPDGDLVRHFRGGTRIINLQRTVEQVAMFDGMLSEHGHFVVDLQARDLARFFEIYAEIDFESGAIEAGLDVTVFYMIDRTEASVETLHKLSHRLPKTRFVPIRNAAIGDALDDEVTAKFYKRLSLEREIVLPELSGEALGMIDHVDFHFDQMIAGRYEHFSFELKTELWGFLESLYAQRESAGDGGARAL